MKAGGNAPWVQILFAGLVIVWALIVLVYDGIVTIVRHYHAPGRSVPSLGPLRGADAVNYGAQKIVAGVIIVAIVIFAYRYLNSD